MKKKVARPQSLVLQADIMDSLGDLRAEIARHEIRLREIRAQTGIVESTLSKILHGQMSPQYTADQIPVIWGAIAKLRHPGPRRPRRRRAI